MLTTTDVGGVVRRINVDYKKLKAAYDQNNDSLCLNLVNGLKKQLILLPTFLNPAAASATWLEEVTLTREVLEYAVLVSARLEDLASFELYFNQLSVYYTDIDPTKLEESPLYSLILGLNLVRLLVDDRIAQFHTELEKVPNHIYAPNAYVRFAVLLERYLMEGSYSKLLNSRDQAPSKEYIPIVGMLEKTVRQGVAECIPHSYAKLSFERAQKILMVDSTDAVREIGKQYEWELGKDGASFVFTRREDIAKREVPFQEMLGHHLNFAADLQRIV
ncbi:proteasome regulatory non-ATP-ase subunit [Trypanosoma equiperdum]|uniref:Proteasome regulatory non-ATP-ase subunit n=4 Tax=Trypanozoon TaxID=39700 RepID=Q381Z4_TRYB2|nr:proteasome regulatory non-ATP-ase subunit,putative [Trypanosoma brucei gambiense DAL972]XP_829499.1 proteasome regulatory non-ATPase subunit [Trypanosoma brucei brucei TREU927]RHW67964.1 proteasome regulatory non-ATP-ase subunit [Trypanosoma brucei equiperdum]SCU69600.1 proteasome regulatory non-ATP-ase subunit [Trypanosoma equiperdum]EAN80387.1 proteasome regulatory non-ATP-ase subunit [Trypanosoma brucei brucei TREU927]CBH18498.1 proteasome regulatory non-ATP-ase subunit,putative [Trypano|eukprot:XP_011780762.1 proteasome regulatory non-ATP-ase subunit,putative [Trypanosoma brucei gambiense DAL972]